MTANSEITLTVHGLDVDNGNVRADVFLDKLRALLTALRAADRFRNEKKAHDYLVVGLKAASAHATLRERISTRKVIPASSVQCVQEVVESVYNGDRNIGRFAPNIVEALQPLVKGIGSTFSHGEVRFAGENVIRIDDFLANQTRRAVKRVRGEDEPAERYFEGIAIETLDGMVQEMDARGALVRGKLVLTAGRKEIDCVFRRSDIETLRHSFDKRARVEAVAHYDGVSLLPVRLDVKRITLVEPGDGLVRWRGALRRNGSQGGLE